MRNTGISFLNVLRTEAQLRIQRDNLNLTRENLTLDEGRIGVGAASVADRYRWESQLASARAAVQFSRAARLQSIEALNEALNLPLTSATAATEVNPDGRSVVTGDLSNEGIEITAGLEAGERVVTAGVPVLRDGQRVAN